MRISDWSSDVCSSDLYQDRLDGSANYIFTNNCGGTTSAMVNRGGSDRRYFCGTLTAPDQVNVDPASYSTHKTDLAIGRLSYDFGPVTLRYTGSWAKYQDRKSTRLNSSH